MISVTPAAVKQIHNAAVDSAADGMSLRVAAHYDEVAGEMQYGIGFDDPRDDDERVNMLGLTILISPLSREAVMDLTIDYVEIKPGDFRFIFLHPNDAEAPSPLAINCGGGGGRCGSGGCSSGGCGPQS